MCPLNLHPSEVPLLLPAKFLHPVDLEHAQNLILNHLSLDHTCSLHSSEFSMRSCPVNINQLQSINQILIQHFLFATCRKEMYSHHICIFTLSFNSVSLVFCHVYMRFASVCCIMRSCSGSRWKYIHTFTSCSAPENAK